MLRSVALLLVPAALLASGCVSKASLDASYDASLQRWQGATRADLEAKWGKPTLVAPGAEGPVLTYVVRNDDRQDRPGATGAPTVVVRPAGGVGTGTGGGATVANIVPGAMAPAVVPVTCTTRFYLNNGKVTSWKFEGLGCGAPY